MTCIATDGIVLASDGMASSSDLIVTMNRSKLFHSSDGSAVGCAGDASACALAREWFEKGEDTTSIPNLRGSDFVGLILRPSGKAQLIDKLFTPFDCDVPAAVGSGEMLALGAMLAGSHPIDAIKIAAQRCTTVGGEVSTLRPL